MSDSELPDSRVIEIYKIAVEMADRISSRRATTNAFFLTLNTTLVAVIGLNKTPALDPVMAISVCIAGVLVSVCWWFLLRNYRRLNEAKFKVINKIENEHLPVKPFTDEWDQLGQNDPPEDKRSKVLVGLQQLGTVERGIPAVFGGLYLILLTAVICQ
ncbi:RipA family octameric membrane protein [Boudabousia marimammalium]|uniref:Small integral membrane protein n=1 Tax=Boudabousia marimammalium TaxID=156892 RepID=A0A1Q5PS96_9ACTO|nr:hypothetical protein [Boudabousia marimammalium]OKL50458.1 hypothetical protein BM477_00320 [Boudabousia marimammalium]